MKNMITGAARAEAAMLLIDAKEGIKENSKRHGYMMSFLGIKNITVCVNKMDLVNYDQQVFENIKKEYIEFLKEINLSPQNFIPISAFEGDNMVTVSEKMPWYKDFSVLEAFDDFAKAAPNYERAFRFPVQDIYKFTKENDDRRIVAGRVESGTIESGMEVIFMPSAKKSKVVNIEGFNLSEQKEAFAGQSTGFTLETQIYINPGELMCKLDEARKPHVSNKFKANIFWMGKQPLVKGKNYKLKIATQQVPVVLSDIISVLDASELSSIDAKPQVDRHDVAECIFESLKPVAFDDIHHIPETGRFVIVDSYEIAGGGIILAPVFEQETSLNKYIKEREFQWERSDITPTKRFNKNTHKSLFIIITGPRESGKKDLAKALEEKLFKLGKFTYFLGMSNEVLSSGVNSNDKTLNKMQYIRRMGEVAHVLTDAGLILITSISDVDDYELDTLKSLNKPNKTIIVNVGENCFSAERVDLFIEKASKENVDVVVKNILDLIKKTVVLDPEYAI
ncbi:Sulfate adenylyltransferase subunit 1 / Adenylylsulfate kinase [hydrothermal vent metagenome]|uniref:Sulfate adenylyltransferase subunit 1 / Adenylylsulfate kinase n=1 Tax=hydrothermal vent metagenome TaxID=652676 RepID=A0A3B1DFX4_9ZZZZ